MKYRSLGALCLMLLMGSSLLAQTTYSPTLIPAPPDCYVQGSSINDFGDVVGAIFGCGDYRYRAFLFHNGQTSALPVQQGAWQSWAWKINNRNQILLGVQLSENGEWHEYLFDGGAVTDLAPFNPATMNNRGQMAGTLAMTGYPGSKLVLWDRGVTTDLGVAGAFASVSAMNDKAQIVGYDPSTNAKFFWDNGKLTYIDELQNVTIADMNDHGQVVGSLIVGDLPHAVFWDGTTLRDLNPNDGSAPYGSHANAINNKGEVVGTFEGVDVFNENAVKVWSASTGWVSVFGGFLDYGVGINKSGQILEVHDIEMGLGGYTYVFTPEKKNKKN